MNMKCDKCNAMTVHNARGGKQKGKFRCTKCGGDSGSKKKFVIGFCTGCSFKMSVNADNKTVKTWWRDGAVIREASLDSRGMGVNITYTDFGSAGKAKKFMNTAKA